MGTLNCAELGELDMDCIQHSLFVCFNSFPMNWKLIFNSLLCHSFSPLERVDVSQKTKPESEFVHRLWVQININLQCLAKLPTLDTFSKQKLNTQLKRNNVHNRQIRQALAWYIIMYMESFNHNYQLNTI